MSSEYFDPEEFKRLNDALKEETLEFEKIEEISNLLNLSEEDKRALGSFKIHFYDPEDEFNEQALNDPEFRKEIKISGLERLFYDPTYRKRIKNIYDNYLK